MTNPNHKRKWETDDDEDDTFEDERDLDDLEPGEPGDGRIIRKRLED